MKQFGATRRNVTLPGVLLACLLACLRISAQSRFDSWTIDSGLPQNSVYSILQTRDGYLWFTTLNGLVRYNGNRFTVFDKANSPGITSNRFTTLFEDEAGSLWAGTEENGLIRFKGGSFTAYTTDANALYNRVISIQGGKEGSLWLLTEGGHRALAKRSADALLHARWFASRHRSESERGTQGSPAQQRRRLCE